MMDYQDELQCDLALFKEGTPEYSSTIKSFRDLKVWQRADDLVVEIYQMVRKFPSEEKFGLTLQLKRASSSVPTNNAEGMGRETTNKLLRFLFIARGSLEETKYLIHIAGRLQYLEGNGSDDLNKELNIIGKMLNALINRFKERKS